MASSNCTKKLSSLGNMGAKFSQDYFILPRSMIFSPKTAKITDVLHLVCFISNVYKQRFSKLVEILKKLSNATCLSSVPKQQYLIHLATLNYLNLLSHKQQEKIYHLLHLFEHETLQ